MKKVIVLIMFLMFGIMTFAQNDHTTGSIQEQIQNSTLKTESLTKGHYQGIFETGYGIGVGKYGLSNFKFNIINSARHSNYSLGIGIGLHFFFWESVLIPDSCSYINSYRTQIPIFLDNRIYFSNKKMSPYFALGIGCSIGVKAFEIGAGFFLNPSAGLSWKISDKITLITGIVYEFIKTDFTYAWDPFYYDYSEYKKDSGSLGMNVGISF